VVVVVAVVVVRDASGRDDFTASDAKPN